LAVREEQAGAWERPAVEIGFEALRRVVGIGGQERAGVSQAERDPACRGGAGRGLDGRQPGPGLVGAVAALQEHSRSRSRGLLVTCKAAVASAAAAVSDRRRLRAWIAAR
jgi:hypothetical protein